MLIVVMTWLGVAGIMSILSHDIDCYYNGFRMPGMLQIFIAINF